VVIGVPAPPGGAVFQLSSDNPAFVAAGDTRQGFLPIVTIPAGQTVSNRFTLFGIAVGQTRLRITPLTPGFITSTFPLGAWDVNKSGSGIDQKFLDANNPTRSCRDAGAAMFTTNPQLQATCGLPVKAGAVKGGQTPSSTAISWQPGLQRHALSAGAAAACRRSGVRAPCADTPLRRETPRQFALVRAA